MNIEIANRLVEMRKAHGLSQEELAARLGISRQAVSKWERAESSPDTDNLIMLSRLYGVSLDQLLATDEDIPRPEPEEEKQEAKQGDRVHISFRDGINVRDGDGSKVHVGWDGIFVHDSSEDCEAGEAEDPFINDFIHDIEVDEDGVTYTENGERVHREWNREKNGRKRFVHKERSESTGKWRTTIVDEDGRKVVLDTNSEPHDDGYDITRRSGFPYAVLVTGVFLLLGFLKQWWHPAWVLFLTIPLYSSIETAVRRGRFNWLDVAVPVVVVGVYVALGMIYDLWHPLWMILLLLPAYYGFTAIGGRNKGILTKVWIVLAVAAFLVTGFLFGKEAWKVNWLLFFTIPMVHSISRSIDRKAGIRWISRFPWELLIVAGYLFVGLMFGVWHPTWIAFLFIPVLRWLISAVTGDNRHSVHIDADDDVDDD